MADRSIVYVDGFNLYYGALRGSLFKWLNLQRYFQLFRPHDQLQQIRYFSALISGPTQPNQLTYLQALETLPLVEVVLEKFKEKRLRCGVHHCAFAGARLFPAMEEKRTDVNIAVYMLDDAYQNLADHFILISGDSRNQDLPEVRDGSLRFLLKPFQMETFLGVVREVLGR